MVDADRSASFAGGDFEGDLGGERGSRGKHGVPLNFERAPFNDDAVPLNDDKVPLKVEGVGANTEEEVDDEGGHAAFSLRESGDNKSKTDRDGEW